MTHTPTHPGAWTEHTPEHGRGQHLGRGPWPDDGRRHDTGQWPGHGGEGYRGGDQPGPRWPGPPPTGTYPRDPGPPRSQPTGAYPRDPGRGAPARAGAGTAAGVVGPPPHRRAGVWPARVPYTPDTGSADPLWWWVGAHGAAGVGALTAVLRCTADAGRCWPSAPWGECPNTVLVARTHLDGLRHAQDLAAQHAAGLLPPGVRLLGLVTVADAPGRLPTELRRLRDLVSAAVPAAWHLPWVPDWRVTARDRLPGFDPAREPIPAPPRRRQAGLPAEYAACGRQLAAIVMGCSVTDLPTRETSSSRAPGRRGRRADHPGAPASTAPTTSVPTSSVSTSKENR